MMIEVEEFNKGRKANPVCIKCGNPNALQPHRKLCYYCDHSHGTSL